ncbi:MAG: GNAT family N-acetyltransferase [Pseudomonadota bacterium]
MEIRRAEPGDLPLMAKMGRYFHEISTYGKLQGYDEIRVQESLLGGLDNPRTIFLVAWEEEKLAGLLLGCLNVNFYDPRETIAQCLFVAVFPEYQKKKVASKLMKEFETWAMDNKANIIIYSGYSQSFIHAMKKKGFEQVEVTLMKRLDSAISV